MPQDGRIPLVVHGKSIDLRVAVLPTMFGESVVLRILDRDERAGSEKTGDAAITDLRVFLPVGQQVQRHLCWSPPTGQ